MNINKVYVEDFGLIESAYNHYVHYLMFEKYRKERKEEGKNAKDEQKKVISKSQSCFSPSEPRYHLLFWLMLEPSACNGWLYVPTSL